MKINEIIKEKRISKKLTQEQVATYLGVSTPAVNKWEKGISYPDVTLLPPLARLLGTDLNTLLSFQEDLSEYEIGMFINELSEFSKKADYQATFELAMTKIKEFPHCFLLIYCVANILGGILMQKKIKDKEAYNTAIDELYERVANSDDIKLAPQAKSMLVQKYINRKEYQKAEQMLNILPEQSFIDKARLQAKLYVEYGQLADAAQIEEQRLLSNLNEVQAILLSLLNIALKDNRQEDAEYIAKVIEESSQIFDLWEYSSNMGYFEYYSKTKQKLKLSKTLMVMFKAVVKPWNINQSPLYSHVKTKVVDKGFGLSMQKELIKSISEDEEVAFIKEIPEFKELIKQASNES